MQCNIGKMQYWEACEDMQYLNSAVTGAVELAHAVVNDISSFSGIMNLLLCMVIETALFT